MKACEVMTTAVVSVEPDTPLSAIAKALVEHGISAVPVLDCNGAAVGMVSDGDLIGRDAAARQARRDWWLAMRAEGEALGPEFFATLRTSERRARDVMTAPAITVGEDADLGEVARLLTEYRIKRVPAMAASSASSAAPIWFARWPAGTECRRSPRRALLHRARERWSMTQRDSCVSGSRASCAPTVDGRSTPPCRIGGQGRAARQLRFIDTGRAI